MKCFLCSPRNPSVGVFRQTETTGVDKGGACAAFAAQIILVDVACTNNLQENVLAL